MIDSIKINKRIGISLSAAQEFFLRFYGKINKQF